jgi:hypothetical protein
MSENTKCILVILSVVIISSLNAAKGDDTDYKIIDSNEVPGVLSMLASATQANYEKIKTWQGRIADVSITTVRGEKAGELLKKASKDIDSNNLPDEIQVIHNNRTEYKIDVANNHFFSSSDRIEPPAYLNPKNGKIYPLDWGPGERIFLVTSKHEIEITPLSWRKKDNAVTSRIAMKRPPESTALTDPRNVFHISYKTLWLTLSQLAQHLQMPNIEKLGIVIKEKSVGGHIIYRIEISDPGAVHPSQIFVLSGEAGFNRTYIENWYDKDSLMSETTTEFIKLDGIFLPKKWEMSQYYRDGGLMRQEDCTIEHQQINIPIPDSKFSELTYLHDGDKFRDKIAYKEYTYQDGNLIEVEKKSK